MKTRWLSTLLLVAGALLLAGGGGYLGLVAYARLQAANFHDEELPREQRGSPVVLLPPARAEGAPSDDAISTDEPPPPRSYPAPQHIQIPSIAVDSDVVPVGVVVNKQGELEWETPKNAVGHNAGTANPGTAGNVVLSGHISSPIRREGNVFNRLPELLLGAPVLVTTAEGVYTYQVVSRRVVEPTEISVLDPTETPTVTLITCYPDLIYSHRLVLRAEPVSYQPRAG